MYYFGYKLNFDLRSLWIGLGTIFIPITSAQAISFLPIPPLSFSTSMDCKNFALLKSGHPETYAMWEILKELASMYNPSQTLEQTHTPRSLFEFELKRFQEVVQDGLFTKTISPTTSVNAEKELATPSPMNYMTYFESNYELITKLNGALNTDSEMAILEKEVEEFKTKLTGNAKNYILPIFVPRGSVSIGIENQFTFTRFLIIPIKREKTIGSSSTPLELFVDGLTKTNYIAQALGNEKILKTAEKVRSNITRHALGRTLFTPIHEYGYYLLTHEYLNPLMGLLARVSAEKNFDTNFEIKHFIEKTLGASFDKNRVVKNHFQNQDLFSRLPDYMKNRYKSLTPEAQRRMHTDLTAGFMFTLRDFIEEYKKTLF